MKQYNHSEYTFALSRIESLLPLVDDTTPVDAPEAVELRLMSDIVIAYEEAHYPIETLEPAELIRLGLEEQGKSQKELASLLGVSTSRVSDFVRGHSEPSLRLAGKICQILNISPTLMLGL